MFYSSLGPNLAIYVDLEISLFIVLNIFLFRTIAETTKKKEERNKSTTKKSEHELLGNSNRRTRTKVFFCCSCL